MTQPAPRHPAAACPTSTPRPEAPAGGPVIPLPARPPRGITRYIPSTFDPADESVLAYTVAELGDDRYVYAYERASVPGFARRDGLFIAGPLA